jgi:hypothetical protein
VVGHHSWLDLRGAEHEPGCHFRLTRVLVNYRPSGTWKLYLPNFCDDLKRC